MSTLALCPSRGRPAAARELLRSFEETRADPNSRLLLLLDDDDPLVDAYPQAHSLVLRAGGCMGAVLRRAASDPEILGDATSVGMVGDDNRFRTAGWDLVLDGWLSANVGVAYGDDLYQHERLPTSWWLSRPLVDRFGMAHPELRHLFMDNWARALGQGAGVLRYFPEVVIEHLHPLAGKAEDDETYRHGQSVGAQDGRIFRRWLRTQAPRDIALVRQLARREGPRNVLADWHHPALWEALSILFEDRFGWRLYSPWGEDWIAEGWGLRNGTPGWSWRRYLEPVRTPRIDGEPGRLVQTPEYPARPRRVVSVEEAAGMHWDYVLSSVAEHQRPFAELAARLGAVPIHQVGNARHPIDRSIRQVVLASAAVRVPGSIRWHQEFSRELFAGGRPAAPCRVTSLMLRLESTSGPWSWVGETPGLEWVQLGGQSPDHPDYLSPMSAVAQAMRDSGWIWHDKRIGDGYGHVLWTAAAMGRPLIGHASNYAGLLGAPLWRDLETCVDLDRHPPARAARLIRAISEDPSWYGDLSERMAALFDELVDWDAEAAEIRAALDSA